MYADKKDWHLRNVEVRLNHKNLPIKNFQKKETQNPMLEEIHSQIVLEGNLDEIHKNRLLEIATRCPVHRTLASSLHIQAEVI